MDYKKLYSPPIFILFAYLFFASPEQIFIVEELEKGVKKYVKDKDRKKEILTVTKATTDTIEAFDKLREEQMKDFRRMNRDQNTTRSDFEEYFEIRIEDRYTIQRILIDNRVRMHNAINQDEWNSIVELEKKSRQKRMNKLNNKIDKGKVKSPFAGMEEAIDRGIEDEQKKQELLATLNTFESTHRAWIEKAGGFSALHNEVIANLHASKEELISEVKKLNSFRQKLYFDMMDFRLLLSYKTNEREWEALIKELDKIMGQ